MDDLFGEELRHCEPNCRAQGSRRPVRSELGGNRVQMDCEMPFAFSARGLERGSNHTCEHPWSNCFCIYGIYQNPGAKKRHALDKKHLDNHNG